MDKQQLLAEVKTQASAGQLSRKELLEAYDSAAPSGTDIVTNVRHLGISEILYFIGGGIVFAGICVLVGQNWETLSPFVKILVTLGSSVAAYLVAILFLRRTQTEVLAQSFFFISALLMPLGIMVAIHQAGVDAYTYGYQVATSAICLAVWFASYRAYGKNLFHIFNVIFGTWLFLALATWLYTANQFMDGFQFYMYLVLGIGLAYIFLGNYFDQTDRDVLAGPLYAFGTAGLLGSTLALQRMFPNANYFWEVAYAGLVFGVIFLSTKFKSRAMLALGSIFLMVYIVKLTGEYFSNTIGWPTSLVIAGLALMAVGYYAVQLKKKYFDKSEPALPVQ